MGRAIRDPPDPGAPQNFRCWAVLDAMTRKGNELRIEVLKDVLGLAMEGFPSV